MDTRNARDGYVARTVPAAPRCRRSCSIATARQTSCAWPNFRCRSRRMAKCACACAPPACSRPTAPPAAAGSPSAASAWRRSRASSATSSPVSSSSSARASTALVAGDEVLGWTTANAYAEAVVVPADQLVAKPIMMSWAVAGCAVGLGTDRAYRRRRPSISPAGDTVLVHGAAGGVGTIAVQLARLRGARVIGTASRENHDYLRSARCRTGAVRPRPGRARAHACPRRRARRPRTPPAAVRCDASIALGIEPSRIATLVAFEDVQRLGVRGVRSERNRERLQAAGRAVRRRSACACTCATSTRCRMPRSRIAMSRTGTDVARSC